MLNLFKNEVSIIAKIHNEFDTAQDRLLQEAQCVLAGITIDNKAERMKSVGFTQSKVVKAYEKNKKNLNLSREQSELILYYQQHYPFQKFLTVEELDRICHKYNLIYASIDNYLEDVPEKNLVEIERVAKLIEYDRISCMTYMKYDGAFNGGTRKQREVYKSGITVPRQVRWYEAEKVFTSVTGLNLNSYSTINWTIEEIDTVGLFIAAPKNHFSLAGLKKKGRFGFFKTTVQKDPIVFRYCRGGIQVITKWGLEASDELVINTKEN